MIPADWILKEGNYNASLLSREMGEQVEDETRYFLPAEKMVKPGEATWKDLEAEYEKTHAAKAHPVYFLYVPPVTAKAHPLDLVTSQDESMCTHESSDE